jgi:hypothetical protein
MEGLVYARAMVGICRRKPAYVSLHSLTKETKGSAASGVGPWWRYLDGVEGQKLGLVFGGNQSGQASSYTGRSQQRQLNDMQKQSIV